MNISVAPGVSLKLFDRTQTVELFHLVSLNREHLSAWKRWTSRLNTLAATQHFIDQNKRIFEELKDPENHTGNYPGFQSAIIHENGIIGLAGFQRIHLADHVCSLGYWIDERWEGKGFVTRSCRVLINYAFQELAMNRVEIQCAVENTRSRSVAERLGFYREARLAQVECRDGRYLDHDLYRLLKTDWHDWPDEAVASEQRRVG